MKQAKWTEEDGEGRGHRRIYFTLVPWEANQMWRKGSNKLQEGHLTSGVITWVTWGWPTHTYTPMLSYFLPAWSELPIPEHSLGRDRMRPCAPLNGSMQGWHPNLSSRGPREKPNCDCQEHDRTVKSRQNQARKLWNQSHSSICSERVSSSHFFFFFLSFCFVKMENKNTRQTGRLASTSFASLWEEGKLTTNHQISVVSHTPSPWSYVLFYKVNVLVVFWWNWWTPC